MSVHLDILSLISANLHCRLNDVKLLLLISHTVERPLFCSFAFMFYLFVLGR